MDELETERLSHAEKHPIELTTEEVSGAGSQLAAADRAPTHAIEGNVEPGTSEMPSESDRYMPPPGPRSKSLRVALPDVELHVLEWGARDRQPVLMIHGMRGHARWFSPVGPVVGREYHALSVDLRGHGESGHAAPYGPATYADDIVALAETLDLRRLIVVGHSMGGSVAIRAVAGLAARVAGLVLVDAGIGAAGSRWQRLQWRIRYGLRGPQRPSRLRRARPLPVYTSWEQARARFKLRPGETIARRELLDHLARHAILKRPDGTFTWRFAPEMTPGPPRRTTDFGAIRCPIVMIYGSESPITQRADPRRSMKLFTSAERTELEFIEGAYHHVFLDCPDLFNETLLRHLEGLQEAAG